MPSSTEFLSQKTFEEYKKLDHKSAPEEIRAALSALHPHLNSHFLLMEELKESMGFGTKYLRVFQALDENASQLYLVVNSGGSLFLGLADDLNKYKDAQLEDFDELWHQVVSVNVSDTRIEGDGLDIWIVVHQGTPRACSDSRSLVKLRTY